MFLGIETGQTMEVRNDPVEHADERGACHRARNGECEIRRPRDGKRRSQQTQHRRRQHDTRREPQHGVIETMGYSADEQSADYPEDGRAAH